MPLSPSLFEGDRLTMERSRELTAESLREHGGRYAHWAIAYSGGKDSTATLTVVLDLIASAEIPAPRSLTVLYADTRMELPPLRSAATKALDRVRALGHRAEVVLPSMDDRFMVYMLGRGVPPPKNRFRWCTSQIKIEPMLAALKGLREEAGEKLLMLTGVRVGESAARDQRIALSCSRDGAECGQGWFQRSTPEAVADTLAPLLHWRVCHVWDWLTVFAPAMGFPTAEIAEVYGGDEAREAGTRTGCVGCNLASQDLALDRLLRIPEWSYLEPLKRLRSLYAELTLPSNRLRKDGETRKDGSAVSNQGRLGPLTMDARRRGLAEVLGIQGEINAAAGERPNVVLIDQEELARIQVLVAANTWPNRWDGTEGVGDLIRPVQFVKGGGRQHVMMMEAIDPA